MVLIRTFSVQEDVEKELNRVPIGQISETINTALRMLFDLAPPPRERPTIIQRAPREPTYPPHVLKVTDL